MRLSQEPSGEDECSHNSGACVADHRAAVQERKRDGTQEVLPRTTTTPVVFADQAVMESRKREDRTAFSERQCEQKIHEQRTVSFHDARRTRTHEYSQQPETR